MSDRPNQDMRTSSIKQIHKTFTNSEKKNKNNEKNSDTRTGLSRPGSASHTGLVSLALTVMLTTMTLSSRRAGVKLAEFRVGYYDGTPADVGSKNGPLLDLSMPMCGKCFFASAL